MGNEAIENLLTLGVVVSQNVSQIAAARLCNSCGGCLGVCPSRAIRYEETTGGYLLPVVDEAACSHCGLCADICPGAGFGPSLLASLPDDPFAGRALESYVGKAADQRLFGNSQSGGVVAALLAHALESGLIKGAVTVSMESGTPPRPMVRIARSRQDIAASQKSKYCPVPLLSFLRDLGVEDGPLAVVGLPCHVHGLRNILERRPKWRSQIAFTIGLVCDRTQTYAAVDYLLAKSGVDGKIPALLHFRDKSVSGYPGDVHVMSDNGSSVVMPAAVRAQVKNHFTPARCRLCFDKMNVFSDITVCDPHGLAGCDREAGESMFVVRTQVGRELVRAAMAGAAVHSRPVEYGEALLGQHIKSKKASWRGYVEAWKQAGRAVPNFYGPVQGHTPAPPSDGKYAQDILRSLGVDGFPSRDALLRHVEKTLNRGALLRRLLSPVHFGKRAVRKVLTLMGRPAKRGKKELNDVD